MEFYNIKDVAQILSVDEETIRRWIRNGKLKAEKLGGRIGYRINGDELNQFLKANKGWLGISQDSEIDDANLSQIASPTISNLTSLNLSHILESLLSSEEFNSKNIKIELIKKEYELECSKANLTAELERVKGKLALVEFELKTLAQIKKELEN